MPDGHLPHGVARWGVIKRVWVCSADDPSKGEWFYA